MQASDTEIVVLLGREHQDFGSYADRSSQSQRLACAISAGGKQPSLSRLSKSPECTNEDAVLFAESGPHCVLAVADAHFGAWSSHALLEAMAQALRSAPTLPSNGDSLAALVESLSDSSVAKPSEAETRSETTLNVVCCDRARGRGVGYSWGDSSFVVVGFEREAVPLHGKSSRYVSLAQAHSLRRERAERFEFAFGAGELVVGFTDGVDECHYRQPRTSIGPRHLQDLLIVSSGDPAAYASALAGLALAGVDGNPGGEDNLAIVVSSGLDAS